MEKRIKVIKVKYRIGMEVTLNVLLTMALHPKMLKYHPKADEYEDIFAFIFLC